MEILPVALGTRKDNEICNAEDRRNVENQIIQINGGDITEEDRDMLFYQCVQIAQQVTVKMLHDKYPNVVLFLTECRKLDPCKYFLTSDISAVVGNAVGEKHISGIW